MSKDVAQSSSSGVKQRMFYVDNLRIYLISLVVLHHVAVGYGGSGGWPFKEVPTDGISPILLGLFNGINQSYFLSFFYLLSGYFLPRSYDRKGPKKCFTDRLIRLGIPVLIYIVLIAQVVDYIALNFGYGRKVLFLEIIAYRIEHLDPGVGPLWFVEALLIFSVVYMLYRVITDRFLSNVTFNPYKDTFPTNTTIVLSIIVIALGTFVVRVWFPVGVHLYHFQLGHFVHYMFCFWLGILASRGKWFDNVSTFQGKLWGIVALIIILCLPVLAVLSGAVEKGPDILLGGLSLQAFVYALWESVACLSIIIGLLYLFRTKFNQQGRFLKGMSPNAYTVYIIHQFVITVIMVLLLRAVLPTAVKFFIVALIGVPMCFIVSHFIIRKIPYSTRVLG